MAALEPMPKRRSLGRSALLACAVAAQLIALQLVLKTPFWGDDTIDQNLRGYAHEHGYGFFGYLVDQIHAERGRFMPVGLFYCFGLMWVLHDRVVYKLLLVVLSVVAVALVAWVLISLSVPAEIAALAAAGTALLFQLQYYHDPLLSYMGLVQMVTICFAVSLLLFIGWLRKGGWWRLTLSALLIVAACLSYEAAYLLVVMHAAVAYNERGRVGAALRASVVPLGIGAIFVFVTLYLRLTQVSSGTPYSISLKPGPALVALARQVSAALPGANFLDPGGPKVLAAPDTWEPEARGLLIGLLLVPILWVAANAAKRWQPQRRTLVAVIVIGLTLMIVPAGLVATAVRYQHELRWGVGYLPVYFSVVGVAVLGALGYAALARKLPTVALTAVCAVLAALAAGVNADGNTRVMLALLPVAQNRDALEGALGAGVLDAVPDNGTVLADRGQIGQPNGPWVDGVGWSLSQWIDTHTGRDLHALPMSPQAPTARQCQDATGLPAPCAVIAAPAFWLTHGWQAGTPWVLLTPVAGRSFAAGDNLYSAPADGRARLVVRGNTPPAISWNGMAAGHPRLVARDGGWWIFELEVPPGALAASGTAAA
jgi:hypothetical protein